MNPGVRCWPWDRAPDGLRVRFAAAVGREVDDHPFCGDSAFLLLAEAADPIGSVEVLPSVPGQERQTLSDSLDTGTGLRARFSWDGVDCIAMVWINT